MEITAAWQAVEAEAARLAPLHLRDLLAEGPTRAEAMCIEAEGLLLDLTREKLDPPALAALLRLAEAAGLEQARAALFAGDPVNATEGRAALHMALRGGAEPPAGCDVAGTLARMLAAAEALRADPGVTDVVNIGIGGSDLGPAMAVRALRPDHDGPRVHFVSNVDGAHLADTLAGLDPARTRVVVASKTFTTLETMANARSARDWLGAHAGAGMLAVSTNVAGCAAFGIPEERVFGFWDWVGGRYSLWSAIGLSLAIAIGATRFREMLAGAAAMDRHFAEAPAEANLPVLMGLVQVWRRSAMGWPTVALVPYDQRLERFPAHVQQLDMESLGKRVGADGRALSRPSGAVIWGEPGTNAQHSFFQLIHQGTDVVPVDFILSRRPRGTDAGHHRLLVANCLAQAHALAMGRTEAEVQAAMAGAPAAEIDRLAPHRVFPGDRPSTLLVQEVLDPHALGRLVALFEHRVFVQAVVWGLNPFDQWGVELGKSCAQILIPLLEGGEIPEGFDPALARLVTRLR